jgi:hypothetical protein
MSSFTEGSLKPVHEPPRPGKPKLHALHGGKELEEITEVEDLSPKEAALHDELEQLRAADRVRGLPKEGRGVNRMHDAHVGELRHRHFKAKHPEGAEAFEEMSEKDRKDREKARKEAPLLKTYRESNAQGALQIAQREIVLERIRARDERIAALKAQTEEIVEEAKRIREGAQKDAVKGAHRIIAIAKEQEAKFAHLEIEWREVAQWNAERQVAGEEGRFERELAVDENGEVVGLKNTFEATPGAVLRAAAPALRNIQKNHEWARSSLHGRHQHEVLRDLEIEAQMWSKMAEMAMLQENAGNKGPNERPAVANLFYKMPQDTEELPIDITVEIEESPMERLRSRFEDLSKQRERLLSIAHEKKAVYDRVLSSVEERKDNAAALKELIRAREELNKIRAERLARMKAEQEKIKKALKKDATDVHGDALRRGIAEAQAGIDGAQKRMKVFKDKRVRGELSGGLDRAEESLLMLKGELGNWMKSDERKIAMKNQREQMEHRATDLNGDIIQYQLDVQLEEDEYKAERKELEAKARGIGEAALERAFKSAQKGFREASAAFYDADAEFNAVAKELVERALRNVPRAEKKTAGAGDQDWEEDIPMDETLAEAA